jgi:hypothetical protein
LKASMARRTTSTFCCDIPDAVSRPQRLLFSRGR